MKGAGGTSGGLGRFFIGLIMMVAGGYLMLNSVIVSTHLSFGFRGGAFSSFGGFGTSGYVFIPFIFGIGLIFYNSKNYLGWILCIASLTMLVFGVITNTHLRFVNMTAFKVISILVLLVGGIGLFLSSLRDMPSDE